LLVVNRCQSAFVVLVNYVLSKGEPMRTRLRQYRIQLLILAVVALPFIVAACGGKKGGGGWG
jgi:hypothetical protein